MRPCAIHCGIRGSSIELSPPYHKTSKAPAAQEQKEDRETQTGDQNRTGRQVPWAKRIDTQHILVTFLDDDEKASIANRCECSDPMSLVVGVDPPDGICII